MGVKHLLWYLVCLFQTFIKFQNLMATEDNILADPSTIGRPVKTEDTEASTLTFKNDAHINSRIKRFGTSSLELE